jgi:hypothetical protein
MSNLRSHHRHLHRLKNVLSVLGALYAFRIFVWRNYFRVALQISSWYRFSAMIGIVLVAFQTVARTYRAFIGHDGLYARLDNLMFGVSYHTQADVFIHRLQGGWSALWVVNLLLEIAVGNSVDYSNSDLTLLLSVNIAKIGLLLPVVLTMDAGVSESPIIGGGGGGNKAAPWGWFSPVSVLRWFAMASISAYIVAGALFSRATELTSLWWLLAAVDRMNEVSDVHVLALLCMTGLLWLSAVNSLSVVDTCFAWVFSAVWLGGAVLAGHRRIDGTHSVWVPRKVHLLAWAHVLLLDITGLPSLFVGVAVFTMVTTRPVRRHRRLIVSSLLTLSLVELVLRDGVLWSTRYRHNIGDAIGLCVVTMSRGLLFVW